MLANRVLLALIFLIAGGSKLFIAGPGNVGTMLASLGIPLAAFFAWVVPVAELLSGISLLTGYMMKYFAWLPVVIMVVAIITAYRTNPLQIAIHLLIASNAAYWALKG